MADSDVQKKGWESQYHNGRKPEARLLVRIEKLEKKPKPWDPFGIQKSPSIVGDPPDAHILGGYVIDGDEEFNNTKITLMFSRDKEKNIEANDYVALGIIKSDPQKNICICMEKVPGDLALAGKLKWLENWKCPKP